MKLSLYLQSGTTKLNWNTCYGFISRSGIEESQEERKRGRGRLSDLGEERVTWEEDRKSQVVQGRKSKEGDAGRSNRSEEWRRRKERAWGLKETLTPRHWILLLITIKSFRYYPNTSRIRAIQKGRVRMLHRRKTFTSERLNVHGIRSVREECHTMECYCQCMP